MSPRCHRADKPFDRFKSGFRNPESGIMIHVHHTLYQHIFDIKDSSECTATKSYNHQRLNIQRGPPSLFNMVVALLYVIQIRVEEAYAMSIARALQENSSIIPFMAGQHTFLNSKSHFPVQLPL